MITKSELATQISGTPKVVNRKNEKTYGICVHTTGGGVPERAVEKNRDPIDIAIEIYTRPDNPSINVYTNFPHYLIGYSGKIIQLADERDRARHVAISLVQRMLYATNTWRTRVGKIPLELWTQRWKLKSPLGLFPSRSPNEDYIGVELIPLLKPQYDNCSFTDDQYTALSALIDDIEKRHEIVAAGGRLLGHEDLSPLTRWNKNGGWDPGSLSTSPVFHWGKINRTIGLPVGPITPSDPPLPRVA